MCNTQKMAPCPVLILINADFNMNVPFCLLCLKSSHFFSFALRTRFLPTWLRISLVCLRHVIPLVNDKPREPVLCLELF